MQLLRSQVAEDMSSCVSPHDSLSDFRILSIE